VIFLRTIISVSTGPIFASFSPNESVLGAYDQLGPLFFPISQGTLPWQPILWKKGNIPSFVALAFQNGMGYCYVSKSINSVNGAFVSCKNFVNFGQVTLELTELICELTVWYGKKTGIFSRISQDILDQVLQSVYRMKPLWVQMINLDSFFHYLEWYCHGKQIILGESNERGLIVSASLH